MNNRALYEKVLTMQEVYSTKLLIALHPFNLESGILWITILNLSANVTTIIDIECITNCF